MALKLRLLIILSRLWTAPCIFSDETLNYWPKYSQLSPACRGAYVDWLASDRNDPEVPLGYVFLYFYGIERRLLLDYAKDEVSDEEVHALYREIVRLRFTYGEKRSFWEYSTRLLEYLGILAPISPNQKFS